MSVCMYIYTQIHLYPQNTLINLYYKYLMTNFQYGLLKKYLLQKGPFLHTDQDALFVIENELLYLTFQSNYLHSLVFKTLHAGLKDKSPISECYLPVTGPPFC